MLVIFTVLFFLLIKIEKPKMKVKKKMEAKNSHDVQLVMMGSSPVARAGAKKLFAIFKTVNTRSREIISFINIEISKTLIPKPIIAVIDGK